jgi:hypothetical protein
MQIDRQKINMMPLAMGPLFDQRNRPCLMYYDVD